MCSASVVGRQDDDDWKTVDVVEQEHQTLACSSSLGTNLTYIYITIIQQMSLFKFI